MHRTGVVAEILVGFIHLNLAKSDFKFQIKLPFLNLKS